MFRHSRALASGLLVLTLLATTACSGAEGGDSGAAGNDEPDQVTYLTAFGASGRDAFAFVAKEKGFFREAGIDAEIELGQASGENVKALVGGRAQFVNIDLIGAWILAGTNAEYKDQFRAIAAVHQQTLVAILALEGGGITSPKDLAGKRIGAATSSVNQLLFPAYAQLAGVDAAGVKWVNAAPAQVPALLASGQVDAVSTFLIGRAGIEKAAGKKTVLLPYNDYLPDLFGNGILASDRVIKDDPELCKRFREALMKGLRYTIDHPDEAAQILFKAQPAANVDAAKAEITSMTPYVAPAAGAPLGAMDEQRVRSALAVIHDLGLVKEALAPQAVVDFNLTPKA
ncbi:ABC transporter substrate-binding protein [Micromonospora sp. NPDC004704]